MPSQSRNFAGANCVGAPRAAIDNVVEINPSGKQPIPQLSWVQWSHPLGRNRSPRCVHIHVQNFHTLLLIRERRFRLARNGIADENLQQVHTPERRGIPTTSSAPARKVSELQLIRWWSRLTANVKASPGSVVQWVECVRADSLP
jgi:hypothetical protein